MDRRTLLILVLITSLFIFMMSVDGAKKKKKGKRKTRYGPHGMGINEATSCDEFSKNARFNPYSVVDQRWFVFYYWAYPMGPTIYTFAVPTANYTMSLKKYLDANVTIPVNWTARQLLMRDHRNSTSLLVERNDRGYFWQYLFYYDASGNLTAPRDVRLKQTSDGRILGYMDCQHETVYVMSRLNDVPPKNRLQEEASRIGYRCRRGKSYLYQGHEWVPIDEDDENYYWARHPHDIDPREQRVFSDLAKLRADTAKRQAFETPDMNSATVDEINNLQYSAKTKDPDNPFSEEVTNQLIDDHKESPAIREQKDHETTDTPTSTSTSKDPDYSKVPTEAATHRQLTEPEEVTKVDSSYFINSNMIVITGSTDRPDSRRMFLAETTEEIRNPNLNFFTNDLPKPEDEIFMRTAGASPHQDFEASDRGWRQDKDLERKNKEKTSMPPQAA